MDGKVKLASVFCATLLVLGIYTDNRPAAPIDFEKPLTLSHKNMLRHAENNVAAAQYVLGTYYLAGRPEDNLTKDLNKAAEWFKKAADNEHATAAFEYARMISDKNPSDAAKYYRQAMAKGYGPAIFALAQLKLREGAPASLKEGIELIYAASTVQDPMAMAYLATLQHEGAGIKKDRVTAVLTMQRAAVIAPNAITKKDWTEKHTAWFSQLTTKEQEALNEQLMIGAGPAPGALLTAKDVSTADLSKLLSNPPIDKSKPMSK